MKHYLPRGGARLLRDTDEANKHFAKARIRAYVVVAATNGSSPQQTANTREVHFQVLFYANLERNRERLSSLS